MSKTVDQMSRHELETSLVYHMMLVANFSSLCDKLVELDNCKSHELAKFMDTFLSEAQRNDYAMYLRGLFDGRVFDITKLAELVTRQLRYAQCTVHVAKPENMQ